MEVILLDFARACGKVDSARHRKPGLWRLRLYETRTKNVWHISHTVKEDTASLNNPITIKENELLLNLSTEKTSDLSVFTCMPY